MRRKNLVTSLVCTCLMAVSIIPVSAVAEDDTEEGVMTEAEETVDVVEVRPRYTALDYVNLGEYVGITVQVEPVNITDEDVLNEARRIIRSSAEAMESADIVQEGDIANIDYVGKLNGEAFDGGSSEGYDLEIGSGTFIDGFEEGLIGVSAGDTVDLELTFPENYYYEELASADVVFTVTVNEIRRVPEELTDEVTETATGGVYTDTESFLDYIRTYLEEDAEYEREYNIQLTLLNELAAISEITGYPQELIDYSVGHTVDIYRDIAENECYMTYEDYLAISGYTEESFAAYIESLVKESLNEELLLMAVAEAEGFELTDEEYKNGIDYYAEYYGYASGEAFEQTYIDEYGDASIIEISLLMDKVFTFLEENAVIEEPAEESTETAAEGTEPEAGSVNEEETETEPETEPGIEEETETDS